jgi:hypothetical protein
LSHLSIADAPRDDDPYHDLPDSWSPSVRETYVRVESEHPEMSARTLASLWEACNLLALADAMEVRVAADGLMIAGSSGQFVPHGLLAEIRQCRVQAMAALRSLGVAPNQTAASRAGAALASKRYQGRTQGVRAKS